MREEYHILNHLGGNFNNLLWLPDPILDFTQIPKVQLMVSHKPHYHGHRKRLRERFLKSGFSGMTDHEVVELLLTLAREKLAAIQVELSEFIRKHDYRFQHEPIGDEKHSWQRAINLVVGKN